MITRNVIISGIFDGKKGKELVKFLALHSNGKSAVNFLTDRDNISKDLGESDVVTLKFRKMLLHKLTSEDGSDTYWIRKVTSCVKVPSEAEAKKIMAPLTEFFDKEIDI